MARCAIVADDLTGANTAGVLLTKVGLRILTIVQDTAVESFSTDEYDGVVLNAMSRAVTAEAARSILERDTQGFVGEGRRILLQENRLYHSRQPWRRG